jgi:hypothetical protein
VSQVVAIIGAGGKMGARAVQKISGDPRYRVLACESDSVRAAELLANQIQVTGTAEALPLADFVVMAVPDALIGRMAHEFAPRMKPSATLVMLDAAAAFIDQLPDPGNLTFMIAHPCHPPMFVEQHSAQSRRDYFGGTAVQDVIVSLVSGSRAHFETGAELCKIMFAPVNRAHEVTPAQFALLEPAMSEIVVATAACLMKASLDLAIEKGVPEKAANAFMAGHAQIAMAIAFGEEKSPFSDAAQIAIKWGTEHIIRPDWRRVFEPDVLRQAIRAMLLSDSNTNDLNSVSNA